MNGAATALSFFSAGPLIHSGSWAVQKPAFLRQWRRTSKDCIGAIDGTHVPAHVPTSKHRLWRDRKGNVSQNVLAACSFDMKFTYVVSGWEGTAGDGRMLKNALRRETKLIVPQGYFLNPRFHYQEGFEFSDNIRSGVTKVIERLAPNVTFAIEATRERKCLQRSQCGLIIAQFELKPPPYPLNSLEPHMSRQTLEYHWGRHQRGYVENLNKQIVGTELDGFTLEDVIIASYNKGDPLPVFNNAAQVWNHDFFWGSMKPGGGGCPSGDLLELIERDFGSYEVFLQELLSTASSQFGSGWAWLVYKANRLNVENAVNPCPSETDNKLMVVRSPNAVNPLVWDYSPLLAIDVWEHAYYLDYENRKADYVTLFVEKLVSWETVSSRLEMAKARAAERTREEEERRRQEDDEETEDNKPMEMYLDSDSDESEVE